MKHENYNRYRFVLKDRNGSTKMDRFISIEEFSDLLDDVNVLEAKDDAELEFYLIKHPELKIYEDGKKYYHKQFLSGKGTISTFVFIVE